MITVVLGLCGALAYGIADFLGGIASRRVPAITVTAFAAVIGVVPLVLAFPFLGGEFSGAGLVWGAVAGVSGSVGVLLLYYALAIGPMSVLSPVTSVFAAVIPVLAAVLSGTRLSPLAVVALLAATIAVALVASVRDSSGARLTTRGLVASVIAGCGFAGLVLAYNQTVPEEGIAPLVIARVIQSLLLGGIALGVWAASRAKPAASGERMSRLPRRFWAFVAICGVFDASANVLIQAALHSSTDPNTLPVVSVLNALYPVGTVLLAAAVLRERLTVLQIVGIVLGIGASVALATL